MVSGFLIKIDWEIEGHNRTHEQRHNMMTAIYQTLDGHITKATQKRVRINNRPDVSASKFPEGYETIGRDNRIWIIGRRSNGSHFWKRIVSKTVAKKHSTKKHSTKKPPTKKHSTKKPSTKKHSTKKPQKTSADRTAFLHSIRGSHSNLMLGSILVFTGKLWDTRKNVEDFVTRHGAFISPNLSRKPNVILVVGEFGSRGPSVKYYEAQRKGVNIVSVDDLLEVLTSVIQG